MYNDDGGKEWLHFYDDADFDGGHNDHDRDDDAMVETHVGSLMFRRITFMV